jgi:hypothetical protein
MTLTHGADKWRKASYSGSTENCVEVALDGTVGVRDTKDPDGGQLELPAASWSAFTDTVSSR